MKDAQSAGRNRRREGNLKPWQGAVVFTAALLLLLFVATPLQYYWGLWGLVATELLVLALAVGATLVFRGDLRAVFPLRAVSGRQLGGVAVLYIASMLLLTLLSAAIAMLAPKALSQTADGLFDALSGPSLPMLLLIAAVLPACCEEALMRGFVLSSLRPLQKPWLIAGLVGVLFGVLHLDPVRFLPTAMIGTVLAVIMLETRNLLLPALFHFTNNFFSSLAVYSLKLLDPALAQAALEQAGETVYTLPTLGGYCIAAAAGPILLRCGVRLLRPQKTAKNQRSDRVVLAATAVLFSAGVLCFVFAR